jgi:N-methylhydantoinase B/oxoprolinase/acetone carboxylase alpha subunit
VGDRARDIRLVVRDLLCGGVCVMVDVFIEEAIRSRILDEHRKYHARMNPDEWAKIAAIKIASSSIVEGARKAEEELWVDAVSWHKDECHPATYESILRHVQRHREMLASARASLKVKQ